MSKARGKNTKPKILRNGQVVDKNAPEIRQDQRARLKELCDDPPTTIVKSGPQTHIRLNSREAEVIGTTGKMIECGECRKLSPTRVMYRYKSSSRGSVTLCQRCDETAEVRSFYKLDALDPVRKKIKVGEGD
jgi:ferredoxin-like protein FixX